MTCCLLYAEHDGPCEWECSDCGGTGRCLLCAEECSCDDVVQCEWCDGSEACPSCENGRQTDSTP